MKRAKCNPIHRSWRSPSGYRPVLRKYRRRLFLHDIVASGSFRVHSVTSLCIQLLLLLQERLQSMLHLPGGFLGECDSKNTVRTGISRSLLPMRTCTIGPKQMGDAACEDPRLAGTWSSNYSSYGMMRLRHGLNLRRIQTSQVHGFRFLWTNQSCR